jgi:hypothetical protein
VPETAPTVDADAARWIAAILEHNHELGVARAESARARIGASRADAERRPDPSVGVTWPASGTARSASSASA